MVAYRVTATGTLIFYIKHKDTGLIVFNRPYAYANSNTRQNPPILNGPPNISVTFKATFQSTKYVSECLVK